VKGEASVARAKVYLQRVTERAHRPEQRFSRRASIPEQNPLVVDKERAFDAHVNGHRGAHLHVRSPRVSAAGSEVKKFPGMSMSHACRREPAGSRNSIAVGRPGASLAGASKMEPDASPTSARMKSQLQRDALPRLRPEPVKRRYRFEGSEKDFASPTKGARW